MGVERRFELDGEETLLLLVHGFVFDSRTAVFIAVQRSVAFLGWARSSRWPFDAQSPRCSRVLARVVFDNL